VLDSSGSGAYPPRSENKLKMKRPSYSKRLQTALEGDFTTEEEKENAVDLLRAVVPLNSIFSVVAGLICLLHLYTGLSHWSEWVLLPIFAFGAVYSARLAWEARTVLKRLEPKPEPVGAGQPHLRRRSSENHH